MEKTLVKTLVLEFFLVFQESKLKIKARDLELVNWKVLHAFYSKCCISQY